MAATTKNIGLTKPAEEEFYDINVQNGNMDIIDKEIGELKNPIFASSDVADGKATEWTSVKVLTSKEKHTSVLAKISQMFKNIRFLNNKYKELNQSLTDKTIYKEFIKGWNVNFSYGFSYLQLYSENFTTPIGYKLVDIDIWTSQPGTIGLMPSTGYLVEDLKTLYCPYYCIEPQEIPISIRFTFERI